MKFTRSIISIGVVFTLGTALVLGCKLMPTSTSTPPLEQLKIANSEISNWQPQGDMQIYIGSQLYGLNDGGAPQYLRKGCIKTGWQVMNGPSGESAQNMVMDFGTSAAAEDMFAEKKSQNSASALRDSKYSDSTVIVANDLGTITGYAHFYNYYFEIGLTNFSNPQDAIKTLNQFLGLYEGKLGS
jgi:hypothetical protein